MSIFRFLQCSSIHTNIPAIDNYLLHVPHFYLKNEDLCFFHAHIFVERNKKLKYNDRFLYIYTYIYIYIFIYLYLYIIKIYNIYTRTIFKRHYAQQIILLTVYEIPSLEYILHNTPVNHLYIS